MIRDRNPFRLDKDVKQYDKIVNSRNVSLQLSRSLIGVALGFIRDHVLCLKNASPTGNQGLFKYLLVASW
ncbi:hypothetical protein QQ045_000054 [Rhodiola kirilowii]